jgi:hypothetical protein
MEIIFCQQYHFLNCVIVILSDGSREIEVRLEKVEGKWYGTLFELPNNWTQLAEGERDKVAKVLTKKVMELWQNP